MKTPHTYLKDAIRRQSLSRSPLAIVQTEDMYWTMNPSIAKKMVSMYPQYKIINGGI